MVLFLQRFSVNTEILCKNGELYLCKYRESLYIQRISVKTENGISVNTENFCFYREFSSLRTTHGLIEPRYS